jgi:uncharacterized membrane protein YqjE
MLGAEKVRWQMAVVDPDTHTPQYSRTDGRFKFQEQREEAPLGDLLRRLGEDAGVLVRDEIALAKLELRESLKDYAQDAAKLAVAAGAGLVGALSLTAFLIIALGDLMDNYWLSALLVTVVLLVTAAVLGKRALAHMKRNSLAPEETVRTLKDDKQWARHAAHDFKAKIKA